jgi:hypothetical protein
MTIAETRNIVYHVTINVPKMVGVSACMDDELKMRYTLSGNAVRFSLKEGVLCLCRPKSPL